MGKIIPIKTIPFDGGVDLAHEAAALPMGALSQDQNFRPRRPGKESRLGQAKHHTLTESAWITETAYVLLDFAAPTTENGYQYECTVAGTTAVGEPTWPTVVGNTVVDGTVTWTCRERKVISNYGFSKSEITERHLFSQYDNGQVREATDNPPTVTTGVFGPSVLAARSDPWPASWSKFRDMLVYTDGAGMGQILTGQDMKPVLFNVYKGTAPIPQVPEEGADYTQEVIDDLATTYADASLLADLDSYNCLFTMFDAPINKLGFELSSYNTAPTIPSWEEYGSNPIISKGAGATWNDEGVSAPTVILDGSTYKMWMVGNDGTKDTIGYYTSSDGTTWSEYGSNPVVDVGGGGTWNSNGVQSPTVILDGATYKMWVVGFDGVDYTVGYYTSSDGTTWTPDGTNPVIDVGPVASWWDAGIRDVCVIKESTTYKMWASAFDGTDYHIGYMYSSDAINWTNHGSNPLITEGAVTEWDDEGIFAPTVISDGAGGYRMWMVGYDGTNYQIGYYTGTDEVTWTEYGSNPVISVGASTTWNDIRVHYPMVMASGSTYKMWMAGYDGSNYAIGYYTAGTLAANLKYWNGAALTEVTSLADGTYVDTYLEQDGYMTWTSPTDEVPTYAFGRSGFLYQWSHSDAINTLGSSVHITRITGEDTDGFQSIQNVWDGITPDAIEAVIEDDSASTFANYSSQQILAGGMAAADYLYIGSTDRLFGFYLDVGGTPNVTATTTIDEVATWTGEAFTALSSLTDGTVGGAGSGYVTWQREAGIRKVNFNSSQYHAYWYRISFDKALSADLAWAIQTLPYFEIDEIYPVMQAACAWDNRQWYSFNDNTLYGTDNNKVMALNGDNFVVIEAAKHSKNKAICMRRFYQFMLVWGEEKGEEGGYFSIIQPGSTASGYDSQVISEKIGIMNNKCAVTLEDSNMGDLNTERPIMKGVYFLSRSGVYKSDGSFLKNISGAIGNYFDPTRSVCIRRGYEKEHFLAWDSTYGVLRLGIVSGGSATVPNKFFVFDPVGDTWHEDDLGQPLSSISEVDGASGDIPVLQYGGGQDGYVYRLNTTDDDVSIAIDKSEKIELDGEGYVIRLKGMALVLKDQTAGDVTLNVYRNGEAAAAFTETFSMVSSTAAYKGKRINIDVTGDHLTVELRNNTISQPVYLLEYGFDIDRIDNNTAYDD